MFHVSLEKIFGASIFTLINNTFFITEFELCYQFQMFIQVFICVLENIQNEFAFGTSQSRIMRN